MWHRTRKTMFLIALAVTAACGDKGPRAIVEGQDSCDYCRMSISDIRFGAQLITGTGKIHTFDSIECLAGFAASLPAETEVAGLYVTDFRNAGSFVAANDAVYIVDGKVESPMGRRVVAFAANAGHAELTAAYGGSVKRWDEVREFLKAAADTSADAHAHDHGTTTDEAGVAR